MEVQETGCLAEFVVLVINLAQTRGFLSQA